MMGRVGRTHIAGDIDFAVQCVGMGGVEPPRKGIRGSISEFV